MLRIKTSVASSILIRLFDLLPSSLVLRDDILLQHLLIFIREVVVCVGVEGFRFVVLKNLGINLGFSLRSGVNLRFFSFLLSLPLLILELSVLLVVSNCLESQLISVGIPVSVVSFQLGFGDLAKRSVSLKDDSTLDLLDLFGLVRLMSLDDSQGLFSCVLNDHKINTYCGRLVWVLSQKLLPDWSHLDMVLLKNPTLSPSVALCVRLVDHGLDKPWSQSIKGVPEELAITEPLGIELFARKVLDDFLILSYQRPAILDGELVSGLRYVNGVELPLVVEGLGALT